MANTAWYLNLLHLILLAQVCLLTAAAPVEEAALADDAEMRFEALVRGQQDGPSNLDVQQVTESQQPTGRRSGRLPSPLQLNLTPLDTIARGERGRTSRLSEILDRGYLPLLSREVTDGAGGSPAPQVAESLRGQEQLEPRQRPSESILSSLRRNSASPVRSLSSRSPCGKAAPNSFESTGCLAVNYTPKDVDGYYDAGKSRRLGEGTRGQACTPGKGGVESEPCKRRDDGEKASNLSSVKVPGGIGEEASDSLRLLGMKKKVMSNAIEQAVTKAIAQERKIEATEAALSQQLRLETVAHQQLQKVEAIEHQQQQQLINIQQQQMIAMQHQQQQQAQLQHQQQQQAQLQHQQQQQAQLQQVQKPQIQTQLPCSAGSGGASPCCSDGCQKGSRPPVQGMMAPPGGANQWGSRPSSHYVMASELYPVKEVSYMPTTVHKTYLQPLEKVMYMDPRPTYSDIMTFVPDTYMR